MASLGHFRRLSSQLLSKHQNNGRQIVIKRCNAAYTDTGAVNPKPDQISFALVKVMAVVIPFLYCGASLSKSGAAFLEENEIFVPDDDDD